MPAGCAVGDGRRAWRISRGASREGTGRKDQRIDHGVELVQVVLQRRARQQQAALAGVGVELLVGAGLAVLETVRLVADHQVRVARWEGWKERAWARNRREREEVSMQQAVRAHVSLRRGEQRAEE